jgi:hypothetical protein
MQSVTSAYKKAVQVGSQMLITAQAINARGVRGPMIPITDGTITYDYTASTRRTCQLAISDPTRKLVPDLSNDTLAPYGQRIKVWMGPTDVVRNPNMQILMGTFWIDEVDADDTGSSLDISIKGYDRSGRLAREALTSIYTIPGGTNVASAIRSLLHSIDPSITFKFSPVNYTMPKTILDINQDPWAACSQIAQTAGMDLYFDRQDVCVMKPIVDPATQISTWTYTDDKRYNYGIMIDELTKVVVVSNTIFNDVIVTGETTGTKTTYSGRAQDTNPRSPTYVHGPFGDIPVFYKSSILTSNAQAQAIAEAKLRFYVGRAQQLTLLGPPNPAQDEEDVVKVIRKALNINGIYTIDKIEFSLAPAGVNTRKASASGQQTLTLRKVIPGT